MPRRKKTKIGLLFEIIFILISCASDSRWNVFFFYVLLFELMPKVFGSLSTSSQRLENFISFPRQFFFFFFFISAFDFIISIIFSSFSCASWKLFGTLSAFFLFWLSENYFCCNSFLLWMKANRFIHFYFRNRRMLQMKRFYCRYRHSHRCCATIFFWGVRKTLHSSQ